MRENRGVLQQWRRLKLRLLRQCQITVIVIGSTGVLLGGCGEPVTATSITQSGFGSPTDAGPALSSLAAPPVGWKAVSSLGVQLAVPKDWPVVGGIAGCEPLPAAMVERGGGPVGGCGYTEPAQFTLVQIDRIHGARSAAATTNTSTADPVASPQPLDRLPATLTEQTLPDGRTQVTLAFDDHDVAVMLRGPNRPILDQIVGTVQLLGFGVSSVDSAGCASVSISPGWDSAGRPAAPKAGVGGANDVSVCAYSSTPVGTSAPSAAPTLTDTRARLVASARLSGGAAKSLLDALRSAPAGPNPDADLTQCSSLPEVSFLELMLHNSDATIQDVRVHYDGCLGRYVATERGLSRVTDALLAAGYGALGMGYATAGPLG